MRYGSSRGLVASMLVLLLGLSMPAAEPPGRLRVATFSCDVTPPVGGHPLIWLTPVATVETPLLAKGIVLDDGQTRCVLCAMDWCGLCNSSHRLFRQKIAAAAGTDAARVAVQCVHQHTAPYTDGDAQRLLDATTKTLKYADLKFLDELSDRVAAAVREAIPKLSPFDRVGVGEARVDRVASNRRVRMPDGKIAVRWSACTDPVLRAAPEGDIDPMLKTVTLAAGEKPLVRLHFYATHPQTFYGDPRASSDMPGFARERLEKKEGVFQIYFTGCAGDVTLGKYNDRSRAARDELTDRLFAGMEAAIAATRLSPADRVAWRSTPLVLPFRTDPGYTVAENETRLADPARNPQARVLAATAAAYARRIAEPLELSVLDLGAAQILCLPGESFLEFQKYAQGVRPGQFVAVAAYGDLGTGYICTERSYAEGGYEPTDSHLAPPAEGRMKEAIGKLLSSP